LAYFDFILAHHPDYSIEKPDILSWRLDHSTRTFDNEDVTFFCLEIFTIWVLEDVKLERAERNMLSNICKGNCSGNQEESIAWVAHKLQQFSSQIVYSIEWSNVDGLLHF